MASLLTMLTSAVAGVCLLQRARGEGLSVLAVPRHPAAARAERLQEEEEEEVLQGERGEWIAIGAIYILI